MPPLREATGLAIQLGAPDLVAELYLDIAAAHLRLGAREEAAREIEEGIGIVTLGEGLAAEGGPSSLWRLAARLAELYRSSGRRRDALVAASHARRHATRARSALGRGRTHALLANLHEQERDLAAAARHRDAAVEEMRRLGDRRTTAELLLAGSSPTAGLMRIHLDAAREAHLLADEIGWTEGSRRASR